MVANTVKVAQGLWRIALTMTSPSTAMMMTTIISVPDDRGGAADRAQFVAGHLAQALAIAAGRHEQDGHVLHAAAEHGADQQPQRAGQVAELHGQGGAHQRAGAGNGGEVVAEQSPSDGWER